MDSKNNHEILHSTSFVAETLKIGAAMVRKWAIAYEAISGDKVSLKSKRDGRYFTEAQIATISRAKELVDRDNLKVDTALRMVLEKPDMAAGLSARHGESNEALEVLQAILQRHDETNQALLEEIRGLRSDIQQTQLHPKVPYVEKNSYQSDRDGPLVKSAKWIEKFWKR